MNVYHEFLVRSATLEEGATLCLRFLETCELVAYVHAELLKDRTLAATEKAFFERVGAGVQENRAVLAELTEELATEGIRTISDLKDLLPGYQTKIVHTIAHILDGFFGIDSCFYNMVEESHWVSDHLKQEIAKESSRYWLVAVEASTIRTAPMFEKKSAEA